MKDTGRKIVARFLAGLAIGLCYVWLIADSEAASAASTSALGLCARVIVPSLFPFFVCSNLFCALGLERPMERVLSRVVEPLFGVPGSGAAALFVGLTGGYPSGAQSVGALYGGGSIDRKTAKRLLLFCNTAAPRFSSALSGHQSLEAALRGFFCISCMLHLPFCSAFSSEKAAICRKGPPRTQKTFRPFPSHPR